jgi:hypothetical protein
MAKEKHLGTRQTNDVVTRQFRRVWCVGSLKILTVRCSGKLPHARRLEMQWFSFILLLSHTLR